MSEFLEIDAPAKINLFLALTGKREDGFNQLISIISKLELKDNLKIRKSGNQLPGKNRTYIDPRGPSREVQNQLPDESTRRRSNQPNYVPRPPRQSGGLLGVRGPGAPNIQKNQKLEKIR